MDNYRSIDERGAADLAEAALTRAFGVPAKLLNIEPIGREDRRNLILRAQAQLGQTSRPVIVKTTRLTSFCSTSPTVFADSGLAKEWVARQILCGNEPGECPLLLAGDAENGLIVFSDFGAHLPSLVKPLLEGTADEAESAMTAYARAMAELHVATLNCQQRHADAVASTFPKSIAPNLVGATWLDQPPPALARFQFPEDDLQTIRSRLVNPGEWLALVHADGCPDNLLLDNGVARLIDFEFSAPGHMLLDAVYWRIGFPSCWCAGVIPEDVAQRIECVYRNELAAVFPVALSDHIFEREITLVTVARALFSLTWMLNQALDEDNIWGTATRRSRILWYLKAAIKACDRSGLFPQSGVVMAAWLAHLSKIWPDSKPLAKYPAFQT
ncbi:hypothetical protein AEAC466_13400 [Asticcacaulis sp. AC466]|uniref:phosphotransferase n=1 Tax=Asticcacaulis sp. AC466 TaxID=1282362 RepID=UPI0003C40D31|nr:phosphotransferase [Asticcacaulis sp. AC466]ESQ83242.1 hypothetical protein AEAC466_13400 [Asticcacaulis sp. AC466]